MKNFSMDGGETIFNIDEISCDDWDLHVSGREAAIFKALGDDLERAAGEAGERIEPSKCFAILYWYLKSATEDLVIG